MFTEMVESVKRDAVRYLFRAELAKPKTEPQRVEPGPVGPKPATQRCRTRSGATIPARAVLARSTSAATALRSAIVSSEA